MEKLNILQKLSAIQGELKVPKDRKNTFGNYKYRSCEDIMETAKPICQKYGAVLKVSDTLENIGDRYYIKATALLLDCDDETKALENTAYAREEETKKGMDAAQITGTASSYARKYALNGLFNIDDTKDADTDEYTKQTKEEPKDFNSLSTKDKIKTFGEKAGKLIAENYGKKLSELTDAEQLHILEMLME